MSTFTQMASKLEESALYNLYYQKYRLIISLLLFLFSGIFLFPMVVFVMSSFRPKGEIFQNPLSFPSEITFQNYVAAWDQAGFGQYFLNSVLVVGASLIILLSCASLAAYALARFDFGSKKYVLVFFIAGYMIPPQVLFVPMYTIMNTLGLLNTYFSLIFTYVAISIPFSIFLLRQFFVNISDSLADAAKLDGCSEWQIFLHIYAPMSKSAFSALLIFQFIWLWNEFLYAITFISNDSMRTLPAGLMAFQGEFSTAWSTMFAGIVIAVLPAAIFFIFFQKHFLKGLQMRTS